MTKICNGFSGKIVRKKRMDRGGPPPPGPPPLRSKHSLKRDNNRVLGDGPQHRLKSDYNRFCSDYGHYDTFCVPTFAILSG